MTRREFPKHVKLEAWKRCGGFCECGCGQKIISGNVQYDHRLPDAFGGEPTLDNCVVMRSRCHLKKTTEIDRPAIDKATRIAEKNSGLRKRKSPPMPGTKASGWKKKMDGRTERR